MSDGSLRTTTAEGDSPQRSEGCAITATSSTPGWARMASSTSAGYTFSPPVMIMSVSRSRIVTKPSLSMAATSPVWSHPSRSVDSVASARFQYPVMLALERITTSPASPGGQGLPSGSTTATSAWKNALPAEPSLATASAPLRMVAGPPHSVSP